MKQRTTQKRGVTMVLVLIFMGVFSIIMGTVTSYIFQQSKYSRALFAREQALHVAEAGLEYYRWFLAHNPSIMVNGTGLVSPYTYTVDDPEGGTIGSATITATPTLQCGALQWVDISSLGRSAASPGFPRTLNARYMKPPVAEYSAVMNSNVWYGDTETAVGPVHSNGGIRMDGSNNADVTSGQSTWVCDPSYGCNPANNSAPGIFGSGSGSALWRFPEATISFNNMALSFPTLRTYAKTNGLMLNATSVELAGVQQGGTFASVASSTQRGYHLVFMPNGTVNVSRVTATDSITAWSTTLGWITDNPDITAETFVGNYAIPANCSLIYSDAKVWVEGTVSRKVTLIVADGSAYVPDIQLPNNITYSTGDGTVGLTAVAEGSVLIALRIPNVFSIRGIFVAQTGAFERRYYSTTYLASADDQYATRQQRNLSGTIVSRERPNDQWVNGSGTITSGFLSVSTTYDRILAFAPPPFTPPTSDTYGLVLWREQ